MKNIFIVIVFCMVALSCFAKDEMRLPNILFIFADDLGRHASAYAELYPGGVNDVIKTPVFDRIADEGVLFKNAHVSSPSCTPSRSALLTGRHFWMTDRGAFLQGQFPAHLPSFPVLLRDAGYHIGYSHKVWGPGKPKNAPFNPDEEYAEDGWQVNIFSQFVTKNVANGMVVEDAKSLIYEKVRANFRSFLSAQENGQPFMYWFGPTNVHRKWTKGSGAALWGLEPDDLRGKMPPFLPDVHEVREDLADYLGEVEALDAMVAVLMEELERSGQAKNTLIVISGDHGAPGFPYGKCNLYNFGTGVPLVIAGPSVNGGRVVDDLVSLTDLAPTFIEIAQLNPPEVMTGRTLWPILESEGEGLVDHTRTHILTGRERHVDAARADFKPYPQRALRTYNYSFIINFHPERWPMGDPYRLDSDYSPSFEEMETITRITLPDEDAGPTKAWIIEARFEERWREHFEWVYGKRPRYELYDLKADPYETRNIACDPAFAELRSELESRLLGELKATGDPRVFDGGRFFETSPMTDPVQR